MVTLLKRLLDQRMKPAMTEQIMTVKNIFILKMETLLTQMMPSIANTQSTLIDEIYDGLQQENWKL